MATTVTRRVAPRWMARLGLLSAGLIATGVVVPLGVHPATLTNFAGYVGWCLWLVGMAVALWRHRPEAPAATGTTGRQLPVQS